MNLMNLFPNQRILQFLFRLQEIFLTGERNRFGIPVQIPLLDKKRQSRHLLTQIRFDGEQQATAEMFQVLRHQEHRPGGIDQFLTMGHCQVVFHRSIPG